MSNLCHPHYAKRRAHYEFMRHAYEGGYDYLVRYLSPHPKESTEAYQRRIERAVYPNLCRVQVQTYAAQLYRSPVTRSAGTDDEGTATTDDTLAHEVLENLWQDIDLMGSDADRFFKDAAAWVQVVGAVGVLVDRTLVPPDEPLPTTRAAEQELGLRPYCTMIPADRIIDWDVDERGAFRWVVYSHERATPRDPLSSPPEDLLWSHTLWTRTMVAEVEWTSADSEAGKGGTWKILSERPNPLGVVPLEMVFWGERCGKHPVAAGALDDLAPMNRRLMNLISLVDEQIYQHVFNILCVGKTTFDKLASTQWSSAGVLLLGDDGEPQPFYLAPDTDQLRAISDEVIAAIRFMRTLSGNVGREVDGGLVPPSGVSMAYQSSDKFALFKEFSERMADLEARVYDLALRWEGLNASATEVSINYSQDFDPVLAARTFEDALAFQALGIGGDAEVENEVQVIRRFFATSLSPSALAELEENHRARRAAGQQASPERTPSQEAAGVEETSSVTEPVTAAQQATAPAALEF